MSLSKGILCALNETTYLRPKKFQLCLDQHKSPCCIWARSTPSFKLIHIWPRISYPGLERVTCAPMPESRASTVTLASRHIISSLHGRVASIPMQLHAYTHTVWTSFSCPRSHCRLSLVGLRTCQVGGLVEWTQHDQSKVGVVHLNRGAASL
jgi:hypothetical protein